MTKILIAVDDNATSRLAGIRVTEWFGEDADVTTVHIREPKRRPVTYFPFGPGTADLTPIDQPAPTPSEAETVGERVARQTATITDGESHTVVGNPARSIVRLGRKIAADVIVVATEDRSWLSRLFVPSVAMSVARRAPCSVLVVRSGDT